jgi:hypothetical protein
MKQIVYDSGHISIDYTLSLYFAKANLHVINIDRSVDKWLEENEDFRWLACKYGEFIERQDCAKEVIP